MDIKQEPLGSLLKKLVQSPSPSEQAEASEKLLRRGLFDFKELQECRRALKLFCKKYPEVERALKPDELPMRSIPPVPQNKIMAYINRESACANLAKAIRNSELFLRHENKSAVRKTTRRIINEIHARSKLAEKQEAAKRKAPSRR